MWISFARHYLHTAVEIYTTVTSKFWRTLKLIPISHATKNRISLTWPVKKPHYISAGSVILGTSAQTKVHFDKFLTGFLFKFSHSTQKTVTPGTNETTFSLGRQNTARVTFLFLPDPWQPQEAGSHKRVTIIGCTVRNEICLVAAITASSYTAGGSPVNEMAAGSFFFFLYIIYFLPLPPSF